MWANINHLVRKIPKLRLFVVASLLVGLLASFAQPVFAADMTGTWVKTDQGLTALRVGTSLYFNPGKEGTHWYMTENAAGVKCQSKVEFTDNPLTNADAAKSGTQRFYKEVAEGAGTTGCLEKTGDANNVTISGTPGSATTDPGNGAGTGAGATATPKCDVGGLSFAICPLINFMADATEWTAHVLQSILYIQPLPLNGTNDLFTAWASILTIANVVLAIAFVFVIFSQATSMALSSYGIKKMLPRIIAAAILMNLSYYICALMVDLSNLAGVGISGFFAGILQGNIFTDPSKTLSNSFGNHTITEVAAGAGVGAIIIFFFLVPVLLAALAVLFTLAARIAIIVLLVMVAPLAFAAWVLPNTEKYFKKWYELFFNMLMIFPLVMGTFAAAAVASQLIQSTTIQGVNPDGATGDFAKTVLLPLIALLVQAMPLFALPFLFKVAGGTLGRINAMTQGGIGKYGGNQAHGAIGSWRKNARQNAMRNIGAKMATNERDSKLGKAGRFIGGYNARRNFRLGSQKSNAEYLQQQAVAGNVIDNDKFARRAAGAGGVAGMNRAKGSAAATLSKSMGEAVDSEIKTLEYQALKGGTTLKKYSDDIAKTSITEASMPASQRTYSPSVVEAAMEAQAREGNMNLFENARGVVENKAGLSKDQQMQSIVDRVISRNVGTFKGKGGFHLQDDYGLKRESFNSETEWQDALTKAKVGSLGNTDALNMNGLKHSWLGNFSQEIATDTNRVVRVSNREDLQKAYNNVHEALSNDTARAAIGDRLPQVEAIEQALRSQGFTPSQKPPTSGGGQGPRGPQGPTAGNNGGGNGNGGGTPTGGGGGNNGGNGGGNPSPGFAPFSAVNNTPGQPGPQGPQGQPGPTGGTTSQSTTPPQNLGNQTFLGGATPPSNSSTTNPPSGSTSNSTTGSFTDNSGGSFWSRGSSARVNSPNAVPWPPINNEPPQTRVEYLGPVQQSQSPPQRPAITTGRSQYDNPPQNNNNNGDNS